jgi:hypothetical protein
MRLMKPKSLSPNIYSTILLRLFLHNVEGTPEPQSLFHTPVLLAFTEGLFLNVYLISYSSIDYIHHVSADHLRSLSFRKTILLCNPDLVRRFYPFNQSIILVHFCPEFQTIFRGLVRHICRPSSHSAHILAILLSEIEDSFFIRNQLVRFYDHVHSSVFNEFSDSDRSHFLENL